MGNVFLNKYYRYITYLSRIFLGETGLAVGRFVHCRTASDRFGVRSDTETSGYHDDTNLRGCPEYIR